MILVVVLCALSAPTAAPSCERHALPIEATVVCPPPTPAVARPGWRVVAWRCEDKRPARL